MVRFFQELQFHVNLSQQNCWVWDTGHEWQQDSQTRLDNCRNICQCRGKLRKFLHVPEPQLWKHFPIKSPHQPYPSAATPAAQDQQGDPPTQLQSSPCSPCYSQDLHPVLISGVSARNVLLWASWKSALWQCSMLFIRDSTTFITGKHISSECSSAFTFLSSSYQQFAVKTFAN